MQLTPDSKDGSQLRDEDVFASDISIEEQQQPFQKIGAKDGE